MDSRTGDTAGRDARSPGLPVRGRDGLLAFELYLLYREVKGFPKGGHWKGFVANTVWNMLDE